MKELNDYFVDYSEVNVTEIEKLGFNCVHQSTTKNIIYINFEKINYQIWSNTSSAPNSTFCLTVEDFKKIYHEKRGLLSIKKLNLL